MHSVASVRSLLFAPGNDARKLARALNCAADGVIADLEDAVPDAEKPTARAVIQHVMASASGPCGRLVRINAAGTSYFDDDLAFVSEHELDAVVLPKATPEGVDALNGLDLPVIAIVETPRGCGSHTRSLRTSSSSHCCSAPSTSARSSASSRDRTP